MMDRLISSVLAFLGSVALLLCSCPVGPMSATAIVIESGGVELPPSPPMPRIDYSSIYKSKREQRMVNNTRKYIQILSTSRFRNVGCGSWQEDYAKMHHDIMTGKLPPRYLISIAPPQGLADRLAGAASQFLMAYFTNRAFLMTAPESTAPLSVAYDYINIDSRMPDSIMGNHRDVLMNLTFFNYSKEVIDPTKQCGLYLNAGPIVDQYMIVQERNDRLFLKSDLRNEPSECKDSEQLFVIGNRGYCWGIFDNPHLRKQLHSVGLRRETTFKCVMDFLLKLKPTACSQRCQEMKTSILDARAKGVMVIAVQVRVGDVVFEPDFDLSQLDYKPAKNHFLCANKLADRFKMIGKDTLFFFISDSQQLRANVKEHYGSRVVTDEKLKPVHIYEKVGGYESQVNALTSSASDIMLFSLAHVHVISRSSGFGQKAAFLSESSNKIHIYFGDDGLNCSLTKFTADAARYWSGV